MGTDPSTLGTPPAGTGGITPSSSLPPSPPPQSSTMPSGQKITFPAVEQSIKRSVQLAKTTLTSTLLTENNEAKLDTLTDLQTKVLGQLDTMANQGPWDRFVNCILGRTRAVKNLGCHINNQIKNTKQQIHLETNPPPPLPPPQVIYRAARPQPQARIFFLGPARQPVDPVQRQMRQAFARQQLARQQMNMLERGSRRTSRHDPHRRHPPQR